MRRMLLLVPVLACAGVLAVAALRSGPSARSADEERARARAAKLEAAARDLAAAKTRRDALAVEAERLEKARRSLQERLGNGEPAESVTTDAAKADSLETMIRNVTALHHEETVQTLTARLRLSPAQAEQLKALLDEDARKALESFRKQGWDSGTPDAEAAWKAPFRRLLTSEQAAAYDAYEAEEKARLETVQVDMHVSELNAALDLRPDQTEAAKALLRKDPSLSQPLSAYADLHPSTRLEDFKARQEAAAARLRRELSSLLDPSQASALDTYLQDRSAQRVEMLELVRAFYGPPEQ